MTQSFSPAFSASQSLSLSTAMLSQQGDDLDPDPVPDPEPDAAPMPKHEFWRIIRTVADFPKPGINFYDITPLLYGHVSAVVDALLAALPDGLMDSIDCLVAIEARGFIFASLLAGRLGKGMILLRKPGKLPPPVMAQSYALEYGNDVLEIANNLPSQKVLLVDDILATGGTLTTAYELCQAAQHEVVGILVLLDLVALHGEFPVPIYTVLAT